MNASSAASVEAMREAAAWLVRLRSPDAGERERREFAEWLKRSPVHVGHYLELTSLDVALDDAELYSADTTENADAGSHRKNIFELSGRRPALGEQSRLRKHWTALMDRVGVRVPRFGLAAAALVVCIVAGILMTAGAGWLANHRNYSSATGEQRLIALSDGSMVTLNTQSEVAVRYSGNVREIVLERGEALFQVAKDSERPFRVKVNGTIVQALGTSFNVYRRPEGPVVTVVEGRVRVQSFDTSNAVAGRKAGHEAAAHPAVWAIDGAIELGAGEQVTLQNDIGIRRLSASEIALVTNWAQRRLVFNQAPVSEVIAQLNRYNHDALIVDDPELASLAVTGTFESGDPDSFVQFLIQNGGAAVYKTTDGARHLRRSNEVNSVEVLK